MFCESKFILKYERAYWQAWLLSLTSRKIRKVIEIYYAETNLILVLDNLILSHPSLYVLFAT
ncbi:hypothetical protein HMPREF0880_04465 [Yokenella regensburgei ATCC 43003]|nr:hypothetical protein HMPREF0880_04465 [Yokenella regensburgei ATCC 43003]